MKMKIFKRNILKIGYVMVVLFLWNANIYIADIDNLKEISAAFQEIFIFLSGTFLTIVGINSIFPDNKFIKSLKQLNVDLHLFKKFFYLAIFSVILVFLPSFLLFFASKDRSFWGRMLIIFEIVVFLIFCVEFIKLIVQLRKIFEQTIKTEIIERKKRL
ncbi:hypothetical protein [Streptococcus orisratti]|uniref:hypothetical protein n=1 Tax=Streptococcus orisratti TaxID=114652 RepID=UPI0023F63F0A|nr:hypothetical protein [Streptococcus orisratti]